VIKKYLLTCTLFLVVICGFGQTYGNEWINYSQKYYRIPVSHDGIYRIDSSTLANAGIPLSVVNPKNFQLFGRGKEQYIFIKGEADGVFNGNDTLEFYGQKNDGFLDSALYAPGVTLPNPYVSLFNDTSMYYLTWNSSQFNHRMVSANDTAFSAFAPTPFVYKEDILTVNDSYFQGTTDISGITDQEYLAMETIVCPTIFYGGNYVAVMKTGNAFAGGPAARLRTRIVTRSNDFNTFPDYDIRIQYPGGTIDRLVDGYTTFLFDTTFSTASLGTTSPVTLFSINPGSSVSSGDAALAFVSVRYPHTPDLEGLSEFKMFVPGHATPGKSYLNLSDFNTGGMAMRFYDLTYHRRIQAVASGANFHLLIGDSLNAEKFCYVTSDNNITRVTSLTPVNGSGTFTNFRLQSGDSAFLIVTNASLMSSAQSYKQYRASVQGGSNHVVLADVGELYDQFAYGIRMHPFSIRRYCAFLMSVYPTKPKNLFLLGKSIDPVTQRFSPSSEALLPTMGYPASDVLFTARLINTSLAPAIATGRLTAHTNADVITYLNKVSAYEQNAPASWMKQVLHFGGGNSSSEQAAFRTYLESYRKVIEADTNFGGHVSSFFKTSSAPIQLNLSDSLKQIIDNGVSIMNFFGHASGNGFDQSIDDPSNYQNSPRFPLIIGNSCDAGDIHSAVQSVSENFIINSKGAVAFIAGNTLGLSGDLFPYTMGLYRSIARYNYGRSIGKHVQYAIHSLEVLPTFNIYSKTTALSMALHSDPSVIITSPRLPDFAISDQDLSFDTRTQPDSVTVKIKMHNYGKAVRDSFFVRMLRTYPDGTVDTYKKMVRAPAYLDTVKIKVPLDFSKGIGLNKFSVVLDFTNRITEMTKLNNATGDVSLVIQGSAILPVWPFNDAIVAYDTITLKASTANPLEPARSYRFEIDTTDSYNSPMKKSIVLTGKKGGIVSWSPPLTLTDSTVYYWRVSADSTSPANPFYWKESSFQYIHQVHGWEQAHFFQFKNDGYQFVKFNRPGRKFTFSNDIKSIEVNDAIQYIGGHDWQDINYKINATDMDEYSCAVPGITLAVLNPISIVPWGIDTPCLPVQNIPYNSPYGNTVCACNTLLNGYDFYDNTPAALSSIQTFINGIPAGYYVIGWTNEMANGFDTINSYSSNPGLMAAFHSLGINQIQNASTHAPYIFLGRKGWTPGQAKEVIGNSEAQKIQLLDTLVTNWNNGYITSEMIGPAKSWGELHWRQTHLEKPSYDSTVIRVIGITAAGAQVTLANFTPANQDINNLGSYVNAATYPYIRLVAYMADDTNRTPPQLKRWQVIYQQAPEMAVNPAVNFSFQKDTVQEGQSVTMTCALQNLSDIPFSDSLLITYWLLDKNHVKHNIVLSNNLSYKLRKPPFNAGAYFIDTVAVSTIGYPGLNSLWMEANPVSKPHTQNEQYHFNNIIQKPFFVTTDKTNPLMDVTFDGTHILDGDIVSSKPNILITLKDENMYLALNDPADFKVFIQYPNSTLLIPVIYGPQLAFTPAVLPKNSCKLNYMPSLATDGVYTLVVQAKDRSNNSSGSLNYQINFEVINHATITDVMNYPNPFTTATHFVFTITGSEVPTMFRIQIMTITGKLVREIERDELGSLHIGRNITEYAWDGRDQYGDRLANGVYFYRVLTKIGSENIEHTDNAGIDQYFRKGFGKMYLMK
jgi:hypothetical protein